MARLTTATESSPFRRLAMVHAVSAIGDASLTVAMAGSLFFTLNPGESRPKVLLYLLVTVAPFALVAPVIGPALDRTRGGRRTLIAFGLAGRAVLCFLMAWHLDGLLLFPLAFLFLVLAKGHTVAKSALVPMVIDGEEELFRANSRLALIGVGGAAVGGLPAALLLRVFDGRYALVLGGIMFLVAFPLAMRIPKARRVAPVETPQEWAVLHARSIVAAGTAMSVVRGGVGFLTFLLAFALKEADEPAWFFGAVLIASGAGGLLGIVGGPVMREHVREELVLAGSLLVPALVALLGARSIGRMSELMVAFAIATGAAAGRVGFDSLLQRDGPEHQRGRAFARFETRFQLVWVVGALVPVAVPNNVMSARVGLFLLAIVLGATGLWYVAGLHSARAQG